MVLVGPSGSGKSTALRMLAGLEEVDAGAVWIGEDDVTDVAPKDRDVAMVFQNYALYPYLDVAANLALPAEDGAGEGAERDRRVREAAELLDLTPYLERKPGQLSGGQRQRVAMGRAIVREPAVFLMDEPLSNLDAKLRVQMRAEIASLQSRLGVTTVYVTHDQVEAMTMGHRVAVLRDGRLQQCDTPRGLYDRPANVFVAGFIGSPAMNLCTLAVVDGRASSAVARWRCPPASTARARWWSACGPSRWSSPRTGCPAASRWWRSWGPTPTRSAWRSFRRRGPPRGPGRCAPPTGQRRPGGAAPAPGGGACVRLGERGARLGG